MASNSPDAQENIGIARLPLGEAVGKALVEAPLPHQTELDELNVLAGVVDTLGLTVTAMDVALRRSQSEAHRQATDLFTQYAQDESTPVVASITTVSHSQESTLFEGDVPTTQAGASALHYAQLLETTEGKSGIPPRALAIADDLFDRATPMGRDALDLIAANMWTRVLASEQQQMANELVAPHANAASKVTGALSQLEGHIPEQLSGVLDIGGKVGGALVGTVPGLSFAKGRIESMLSTLEETPAALGAYIADITTRIEKAELGREPRQTLASAYEIAEYTTIGYMAAQNVALPEGVLYEQVAAAIATRAILRDPATVFSDQATPNQQEIVLRAKLAASLDKRQVANSLTGQSQATTSP